MKIVFIVTLLVGSISQASPFKLSITDLLPPVHILEGGAVGSGGGSIVCKDPATQQIKSAELLDFFEARVIRDIKIDIQKFPGSWKEKVQAIISRLGAQSVLREKVYSIWLKQFEGEAKFLKGVEFSKTQDSMHIGVPVGCEFVQAAVQILPSLPGDNRYYINQDIWDALNEDNKAGLVLHEMVYREALSYGHTDSILARFFVENIASDKFENFDIEKFYLLVRQSHFEQTDVPWTPQLKVSYSPYRWWRLDSMSSTYPDAIELTGRMVENVGFCAGTGCNRYQVVTRGPGESEFCYGVESISIGATKIEMPWQLSRVDEDGRACDRSTVLTSEHNGLEIYTLMRKPVTEYQFTISTDGRTYTATRVSFAGTEEPELYSLTSGRIETPQFEFKQPDLHQESDCKLFMTFASGKVERVHIESSKNLKCEIVGGIHHPGYDLWLQLDHDHQSIDFFYGTEAYKEGGQIIQFHGKNSITSLSCYEAGCIKLLDFDQNKVPTKLQLSGKSANLEIFDAEPEAAYISCVLDEGIVDLHLQAGNPKIVTVGGRCNLFAFDTANEEPHQQTFAKGSILELDEQAQVIRTLREVRE